MCVCVWVSVVPAMVYKYHEAFWHSFQDLTYTPAVALFVSQFSITSALFVPQIPPSQPSPSGIAVSNHQCDEFSKTDPFLIKKITLEFSDKSSETIG